MALVDPTPDERIAAQDADMVASGLEQYGELLETWRAVLHRPGLFAAYLPFLRAVAGPGEIDLITKDLSAILVGYLNGCSYTVSHRYASARRVGASDELLELTIAGEWSSFDPARRAALELTRRVTLDTPRVSRAEHVQVVDSALLDEIRSLFSDEQIVELMMSISMWNGLARFHRVMGFDLDMPAAPSTLEPK